MTTMTEARRARNLTGHDRCDRCGAQAYFLCMTSNAELTFCGHHGLKYKAALELQGFTIFDQTSALVESSVQV